MEVSRRPRKLKGDCNRLWRINDHLTGRLGRKPTIDEAAAAAVAEGLRETTARSEYARWSREHDKVSPPTSRDFTPAVVERVRLTVAENGRIVIPKSLRDAMSLDPDGVVTAFLDEDGVVMLMTPDAAIAKAQRLARLLDRGEGSVVDELIAERRAEAAREDAEA